MKFEAPINIYEYKVGVEPVEFTVPLRAKLKFSRSDLLVSVNGVPTLLNKLEPVVTCPKDAEVSVSYINADESGFDSVDVVVIATVLAPSAESGGGERLVDESYDEPSQFDLFKQQMLAMMSQMSEEKGQESFDEFDDMEYEDDDENLVLTPYEYQEMKEEFLRSKEDAETSSEVSETSLPESDEASGASDGSEVPEQ